MTKERALELIGVYGKAWETSNADLILTIFMPDATYFDPHEGTQVGHAGIRAYWESKVIGSQKNIVFKLLNLWIDGNNVIAEWHATFFDTKCNVSIDMTEVAIFEVAGDAFSSLREYYWTVKKVV